MAEVYREYARPLFALLAKGFAFESGGQPIAFRGYADRQAIECAVHEVFTRAFSPTARQAYDGLRPYRNYLFSIARNLVIDAYRAKDRVFVAIEELSPEAEATAVEEATQGQGRPDDWAEQVELKRLVDQYLAALLPEEKAVFAARFQGGASVEETARKLALSEHRVKKTEKLLRKRFFKLMHEGGYFAGYRYGRTGLERLVLLMVFGVRGIS